jgi:MoaA/NifB/PqqE/SkfB family radical SAM enzyme
MPIVILYVTEGCNLRCAMCSYRNPLPEEMSVEEISTLARELAAFGLRHIVFSGGEPLLRRDFPEICELFAGLKIRESLLTNGLLLEKRYSEIGSYFSEIIVSLDGPDAPTHDGIRGQSFDRIVRGIRAVKASARPDQSLTIRTVIQKRNFREIPRIVEFARDLGVDRVSFLAADASPDAFGRDGSAPEHPSVDFLLSPTETEELRGIVSSLVRERRQEFERSFISESPAKLYHIVEYFEACAARGPYPPNTCNAPNVSAVITSRGEIKPCFFLPGYGNIRAHPLKELANSPGARSQRRAVKERLQQRCTTCVCTLSVSPRRALAGRF